MSRFQTSILPVVVLGLLSAKGVRTAVAQQKPPRQIGFSNGIFVDRLDDLDAFGQSVASIGDLDRDGVNDLVVGAPLSDDGGDGPTANLGAVWVLFLNPDGTVRDQQKISATKGGFTGDLQVNSQFGSAVSAIGDLDGDGIDDIAVGAPNDAGSGREQGAIWILFLTRAGTVKGHSKIDGTLDPLIGALSDGGHFGQAVTSVGDIDGDGAVDLAVGAPGQAGPGQPGGALWMISLRRDGGLRRHYRIDSRPGMLGRTTGQDDRFGAAVTAMGDLDGDGITELAVGAPLNDGIDARGGENRGAVWVLFLDSSGEPKRYQKIGSREGGFEGVLDLNDHFGDSVAGLGDIDGDGVADLAVGSPLDDDGGITLASNRGAVWMLFLASDGTVKASQKLSSDEGDFTGELDDDDLFGTSLAAFGDLDGDGVTEIAIGAPGDDDGGGTETSDRGALWIVYLRTDGTARPELKLSNTQGGFATTLDDRDRFGSSVAGLGDLDGDGIPDLAVGADNDDDGGLDSGALWLLFLNSDGSVRRHRKVSNHEGEFDGILDVGDHFGRSIAALGDLDGDGVTDIAVGAPHDDDGGANVGAVWILFLTPEGTVKSHRKLGGPSPALQSLLRDGDEFGTSVASLGDFDGNGVDDIVVGGTGAGGGGLGAGSVWILFLDTDLNVQSGVRIDAGTGALTGRLNEGDGFGSAVASPGDLTGDGVSDLLVGAPQDDEVADDAGEVWFLEMGLDGSVKAATKIRSPESGSAAQAQTGDQFGTSLATPGDIDGDGFVDLVVGTIGRFPSDGWIDVLLLGPQAEIQSAQRHGRNVGDFSGVPIFATAFGAAVAALGDLDGDSLAELAIGAPRGPEAGLAYGASWISFGALLPPPTIQSVRVHPNEPAPGEEIRFTARIDALDRPATAILSFRSSGDTHFLNAPMTNDEPGVFALTLPRSVVDTRGVEYFVTASNEHGYESRHPVSGFFSLPAHVRDGLSRNLVSGTAAEAYRLFSIPLDPEVKSARAVLEDDLGTYDRKQWRFYGNDGAESFTELDISDMELEPGTVFWLLTRQEGRFITTGAGRSVQTDHPFSIALDPGWNYIGNPFNFPIPASNLSMRSGQPVDTRKYEGFWGFADDQIEPWSGYAVYNAEPAVDTIDINPDLTNVVADSTARMTGKDSEMDEWSIRIIAEKGLARDSDNLASVSTMSTDEWDFADRPEAPPIGNYISVSFPHPEWNQNATHFTIDSRAPASEGIIWDVELTAHSAGLVTLHFDGIESMPENFQVRLVDELLSRGVDLRTSDRYTVVSPGSGVARKLRLIAGTEAFLAGNDAPSEPGNRVELLQNFPNPFRGATTIQYSLPNATEVTLTVYDALGRRVAALVNDEVQTTGRYVSIWDGRSGSGGLLASGMYLIELRAGEVVLVRQVTISR